MAKKNDDFFKVKKPWSEVKDELLGCYLKPYIQKILHTQRPIIYVDCFAGKGKFEDGKPGSPLIALNTIQGCLGYTKMNDWNIKPFFIDVNYADDLRTNLTEYGEVGIISGRYEDEIEKLLSDKSGCNVFLYIDPYGIKALNYGLFQSFSTRYKFNSIELLINMNSFGFIREGCRVLGVPFEDASIFEDLIEYESTKLEANEKSVNVLNNIAGGDYWQEIIKAKNRNEISVYEAEAQFAEQYCDRLRQNFKYVLNMPLKIKRGQLPKYRMIHATNHVDGCLLMVDNICCRWQLMKDIQDGGQMQLWEENYNNDMVDEEDIRKKVVEHVSGYFSFCRLNIVLADFFMKYGPICKASVVKSVYKDLEDQGMLEVQRTPAYTKGGKPSSFFADEKKQRTEIRWHS
ncbi:three-Cys-motif partner protein TcmP [Caproiciproducens faecalis]|uniref:Three-Cys-motif partner protein TcmP n=1 Tax=Caproiciproducens faecalis TaxID=2820301 RepID=A0ABS7DL60_9FIRM|nr:three-Cys-motif partner protein TcmP [Caproiciproducens faecalis]MBW7571859.1 three-Cys-motif partner protein TcmP [Caproiciproducens faecalis]